MSNYDYDPYYIKAIGAMHSKDHLCGSKPLLQTMLEEAIKAKYGIEKDLSPIVQKALKYNSTLKQYNSAILEDPKPASSSDELELDLLKEDLMCIICQAMDVGARNRLLECSDCHCLYHQECHQPAVSAQDADVTWICRNCKETKKIKKSPTGSSGLSSTHLKSKSPTSHTTKHSSSGYKSSRSSSSKSSSSKSSSSSPSTSGSSSSSRPSVTTHIISADKRLQSMKRKAAKQHHDKKKSHSH